ncbi:hypothetical protein [Actinoplanes sp. NBRC 103695]|uniref:hypothetical protein n=1 Tax=Actinoplanes sp. NBRC 103695 TaxID=3032202 RepID=UPI0025520E5D|nr:hypothetical protein [Actinoplanes sp. NBRC 103695]
MHSTTTAPTGSGQIRRTARGSTAPRPAAVSHPWARPADENTATTTTSRAIQ